MNCSFGLWLKTKRERRKAPDLAPDLSSQISSLPGFLNLNSDWFARPLSYFLAYLENSTAADQKTLVRVILEGPDKQAVSVMQEQLLAV